MEVSLKDRDPKFVKLCQDFILCMRKAGEVIPFDRCWVPEGYKLIGFVTSLDGGRFGYGITIHVLAEKEDDGRGDKTELRRRLVMTNSKICKRTAPSHESLAGKLGSEALFDLLQPWGFEVVRASCSHSRATVPVSSPC